MRRWHLGALVAVILVVAGVAFAGLRRDAARLEATAVPAWDDARLRLRIDISERRLYVEEGGEVTESYPVAVGTKKHPTPRGAFAVRRVIWNPRWVPPKSDWAKGKKAREPGDPANPMGKAKIFFKEPDYYVHGTNAPSTIGSAASHGCVRMRNADVVELGQLLMERGDANVEPGLIQRLINRVRQTKEVRLGTAVPLRVVG